MLSALWSFLLSFAGGLSGKVKAILCAVAAILLLCGGFYVGHGLGVASMIGERDAAVKALNDERAAWEAAKLKTAESIIEFNNTAAADSASMQGAVDAARSAKDEQTRKIDDLSRRLAESQRLLDDARRGLTAVANQVSVDSSTACERATAALSDVAGRLARRGGECARDFDKCDAERSALGAAWPKQ
ncbi:MAG: hypothetical protein LBR05_00335 [Azoarcus sp.]|jgi:hypothetical protein|nr:hypothetical protein [Azoarcus sp.]